MLMFFSQLQAPIFSLISDLIQLIFSRPSTTNTWGRCNEEQKEQIPHLLLLQRFCCLTLGYSFYFPVSPRIEKHAHLISSG